MRRLWIERRKAAAAGMVAMKVYIEDPEKGDTDINGIPCRKLGVLKNGKKARFAIGEEARKVFVVADKVSRNLYNAFVQLPEGQEDVFLSGRNYLKPFSGNPFRFDGVEEDNVLENRKRVSRVGTVILVIAVLLGIAGGAAAGVLVSRMLLREEETPPAVTQVFGTEGIKLTLTDRFAPVSAEGTAAAYRSEDAVVYVLREDFDSFAGFEDLSPAGYGTMVLENNGLTETVELREEGNAVSFEYLYTREETGDAFYYYCVAKKGADAFWLIQFAAPAQMQSLYAGVFPQWAELVVLE